MKTGEILKLLNTTENTLRYYEKKGVIHPKRDRLNYREYDRSDISAVMKCMKLTDYGFSVEKAGEIQKGDESEFRKDISGLLEERKKKIRLELAQNAYMERILNDTHLSVSDEYFIEKGRRVFYLPYCGYCSDTVFSCADQELFSEWMKYVSITDPELFIPVESFRNGKYEDGYWCLTADYEDAETLSEPVISERPVLEETVNLCRVYEIDQKNPKMMLDKISEVIRYADQSGRRLKGIIRVLLITSDCTGAIVKIMAGTEE